MSHNLTHEFEKGLKHLDMLVPDLPETSGLVFVDEFPSNEYEYIALEKAKKYDVDAVYFRRFDSGRASIPQIYIYDFTARKENEDDIAELHKRLWNAGQVPLFFIFNRTEVKIFNCLKSPDVLDIKTRKIVSTPMEIIELAAEVETELDKQKEFSARKFDNGSFWETSRYKDNFNLSDGSYETLLTYLKIIRDKAIKEKILGKPIIQKLLVMTILVKYLEERQDSEGNTVFPESFFSRFAKDAQCFTDVLKEKGACLKLFDNLSQHFNGEIFKWDDKTERDKLSQTDLKSFASLFLEARTDITGQRTLWPLYSFNDLPIELISNLYEEFLGNKEGIVYTPPYLVRFLIDEAMPLVEFKENFKVLDPACGSGVFLVAAYQRIIDWWRIRNDWRKPDLNTLKKLLRSNIYGVDIDPEAVRLTIFSLSLALFDELSPKEIWEDLKFDDLKSSGNLHEKDFFELILHQKLEDDFDLVIGNPPFIEKFTTLSAKEIEKKQQKKRVQIPGNQLALLFLEQSMTVCKAGGLLCLISPAGPFLYNNNSFEFRKYFLKTYNVKQIVDFTALSEVLFGRANVAILSIFVKKEKSDSKKILHVTVRRTKPSKEKIYFELDYYDFFYIPYEVALNDKLIWKSNFLGGGRLHYFISRLSNFRKFSDYLEEKKKSAGWVVAEGFIVGNKNEINRLKQYLAKGEALSQEEINELRGLEKKFKKADYLTGGKTLPTKAFTEIGIDETQIYNLEEEFFYRRAEKNKLIFKGPHVLIKEGVARKSIPIALRSDNISFRHRIIGIHAPANQIEDLKEIENRIMNNKSYLFFVAGFSGEYMIKRATAILKKDIDFLPYPEDEKELELSDIEKIFVDDVLKYILDFRRKGENSKAVRTVNGKQLENFGETYCKILNTVYKEFKPHKPIITDSFICFPIYFGKQPKLANEDLDKFENYLDRLVYIEIGRNLRIVRVLRVYDNNIVYLIKPNQVRYWLRSVAIRDADETFADLVKQGY